MKKDNISKEEKIFNVVLNFLIRVRSWIINLEDRLVKERNKRKEKKVNGR